LCLRLPWAFGRVVHVSHSGNPRWISAREMLINE
jgi:hypothetical protein